MNTVAPLVNALQKLECKLRIKQQYGRQVYLPANDTAQLFCEVANTITMTEHTIRRVRQLGYVVTYLHDCEYPLP